MPFNSHDALKLHLNQRGLRMTPQREKILQVFENMAESDHISAEELYRRLQNQGKNIGLSTIYRTLHLMTKIGFLRELELAEGHKHYEINLKSSEIHHHLLCIQCHRTIEFKNDQIVQISQQKTASEGFKMIDCQLTIHGVCQEAIAQGWPYMLPKNWACDRVLKEHY